MVETRFTVESAEVISENLYFYADDNNTDQNSIIDKHKQRIICFRVNSIWLHDVCFIAQLIIKNIEGKRHF